MKVLVINHCSTNKGDKAVLEFVLRELIENGVKDITVSANEPSCCNVDHLQGLANINVVPWGWNVSKAPDKRFATRVRYRLRREFFKLSYKVVRYMLNHNKHWHLLVRLCCAREYRPALQSADLVVSTGGHHVTSILAPDTVSPQTFEMATALLCGKKLHLWSQSIGPFTLIDDRNKLFIKNILSRAAQIFIRDILSFEEIGKLGLGKNNLVKTYESVFGLSRYIEPLASPLERPAILGISVYSAQSREALAYKEYIESIATVARHAISLGYKIVFFSMQVAGEVADDRPCINDILTMINNRDACTVFQDCDNMIDHINEVAKCRLFVGHKTHSIIFALLTGTPLLAIAYHPKARDFLTLFGLEQNCIDDSELGGEALVQMLDRIIAESLSIYEKEATKCQAFSSVVSSSFKNMLES
ncbi:MAG: polysaccharide pyruvyl transferase family protein [Deltaproteobacteria bacterium]|nr:polysaccharide pyruvyl transferase family protein [Deltaproteobacteria bacterium]